MSVISLVRENIQKVIIGKESVIDLILTSLIAGGHVLLEDVPGTGKTMLARSLAKSVDAKFSRIQFTPDLLPSDVTGLYFYNQKESAFTFREGPVFCNLLLADEINRATPRTQSALLECMEEKQVTIDGNTHMLEAPFFVIATENPIETAGTFPLPEAQLDRFLMKISVGHPTKEEEIQILERFMDAQPLQDIAAVCSGKDILRLRQEAKKIYCHPLLLSYLADIVQATRNHPSIVTGASPRGSLALLRAAQSYAMIQGRTYVVPEDLKMLAVPVLSHRLVCGYSMSGAADATKLMETILDTVPVPTEKWER